MFKGSSIFYLLSAAIAIGPAACSKDDEKGVPAKVIPRTDTARSDAGPQNAILESCEPNDMCTGAASCMGVCGMHELGDRACSCGANALTCTACALNADFRATVSPAATVFCPPSTDDGDTCAAKGETCIDISYNNAGVGRRDGCLCWPGRTMRLQWDCSQNLNGFFQDMAPPTPPAPDAGAREGGTPPPPPPPVDAAATTD